MHKFSLETCETMKIRNDGLRANNDQNKIESYVDICYKDKQIASFTFHISYILKASIKVPYNDR